MGKRSCFGVKWFFLLGLFTIVNDGNECYENQDNASNTPLSIESLLETDLESHDCTEGV